MKTENQLLESDPKDVLALTVGSTEIAAWTDDKKGEFVGTFQNRTRVARYLLERTAFVIVETALRRKFIGTRHAGKVLGTEHSRNAYGERHWDPLRFFDNLTDANRSHLRYHPDEGRVGGREPTDLDRIAEARAEEVLSNLPPLRQAVQIIDPNTAKMLDRIEALKAQGDKLKDEAEEASEPIVMAECDQAMTIGAFRQMVKERDKKRRALLERIHQIGKEGTQLEETVAKKLYKGLPGLSDAVVDVAKVHFDRSTALDELSRRVEEQVKFGDSDQALELLRHFEKDEAAIPDTVKAQFTDALEKLKLSVKGKDAKAKKARPKSKELRA